MKRSIKFNIMRLVILFTSLIAIISLTGCGDSQTPSYQSGAESASEDVNMTLDKLTNADTITLNKDWVNITGDEWNVIADGEKVATIEGEFITILGDVYTLRTSSGNTIMSEDENILYLINRNANKYDADGNQIGHYKQNFLSIGLTIESYDNNDRMTLKSDQKVINLTDTFDFTTDTGEYIYEARKHLLYLGANYDIIKKSDDYAACRENIADVIMMTAISNEIIEANNSKSK